MNKILIFVFLTSFFSCQNSEKKNNKPNLENTSTDRVVEQKTISNQKQNIPVRWNSTSFKNFTFELPSDFEFQSAQSNYNKKVYINGKRNLGLTIDIANLPSGYEESVISELIPDLNEFGKNINTDNRRLFSDFQLLSTKNSKLGNNNTILVSQTSTKVSGKNISMIVKAHFAIAKPYYCSITFSYPGNSFQGEQTINKIMNSFKFDLPKRTERQKATAQSINEPSLKESQDWLIEKLSKYLLSKTDFSEGLYGPINKLVTTYQSVGITNGNLTIKYNQKFYEPYVDEKTQRNYNNAGISQDMALRMTKDKKLTRDENFSLEIPINSITTTNYDKTKNYNGECDFSITASNNDIIKRNITKGKTNYDSYFSFTYDCSKEDDLGNRINKALEHIKKLTPKKKQTSNEAF